MKKWPSFCTNVLAVLVIVMCFVILAMMFLKILEQAARGETRTGVVFGGLNLPTKGASQVEKLKTYHEYREKIQLRLRGKKIPDTILKDINSKHPGDTIQLPSWERPVHLNKISNKQELRELLRKVEDIIIHHTIHLELYPEPILRPSSKWSLKNGEEFTGKLGLVDKRAFLILLDGRDGETQRISILSLTKESRRQLDMENPLSHLNK